MENETKQMLELILNKLAGIEKGQESMEKRQKSMEKRQESMEKRQENIEKRQNEIFEVVKAIEHSNHTRKAEIDNLIYKVAHVEATVNGVGEFIENRKAI